MAAATSTVAPSVKEDILSRICKRRVEDVAGAKATMPVAKLRELLQATSTSSRCVNLATMLDAASGLVVAAEFKRASPSKGVIAAGRTVEEQTRAYCQGGASVLSVLTEPNWFQGSLEDLAAARATAEAFAAETGRPRPLVLRKDFIVDPYQIMEAKLHGADTVLLIVAWLESAPRVREMLAACRELGMEPFVEVASLEELTVALEAGSRVVGVNNRNLRTFEVDPDMTARIAAKARELGRLGSGEDDGNDGRIHLFAFSGIKGTDHIRELRGSVESARDISGVLLGEFLMRSATPEIDVASLASAWASATTAASTPPPSTSTQLREAMEHRVLAKVCGLTTTEAALHAAKAGASMVGMILCPGTSRTVTWPDAAAIVASVRKYRETSPTALLREAAGSGARVSASGIAERTWALVRASRRSRPLVVGVFRNQSPKEVAEAVAATAVDVVQLHGDEDPTDSGWATLGAPVIKVVHVSVAADSAATSSDSSMLEDGMLSDVVAWSSVAAALLLDTKIHGRHGGGTGVAFDWTLAARVAAALDGSCPVGVAGGLTPESVARAAADSQTWLLDVSSGVEVEGSPGTKHPQAVTAFCKAVAACSTSQ